MADLIALAGELVPPPTDGTRFTRKPYTRVPVSRTPDTEVVLIGFVGGQTSSVHDHRGSRCVVRVVRGRILETMFRRADDGTLEPAGWRVLEAGAVSGLEGDEVHQVTNLDPAGTVLLNVYSPPTQFDPTG